MPKNNQEEKTGAKVGVEEDVEQKYLELNLLDSQMKQAQNQIQAIEEQMIQTTISVQAINEIEKLNKDSEVLIPITPGVFAKGRIVNTKELIVSIGADTCVTKTPADTKKMLQEKIDELKSYNQRLLLHIQQLNEAAVKVESQLKELVDKANKANKGA